MKILSFDTETTGLFNYSLPADAEGQPRICQISAFLLGDQDSDGPGQELPELPGFAVYGSMNYFVKPDGWEYPPELAQKLGHDRDTAFFERNGTPVLEVLENWQMLHQLCDVIVGFNIDYDLKVMRGALRRAGRPDNFGEKPKFCTMRQSGKLCGLRNVKGGYKNPTLAEAAKILCGFDHQDAHDAITDNLANIRVFRELRRRGVEVDLTLPVSKPKRETTAAPPVQPAGAIIGDEPETFLN